MAGFAAAGKWVSPAQKERASRIMLGILGLALKLVMARVILFAGIIGLLYACFPALMANSSFAIAAWLYFMGPTGFGIIAQISSLLDTDQKRAYCSSAISLNMIVTLMVYVVIVLLQG